ncbi:hypothetical protein D3C76_1346250 [compost metagenome]
MQQAGVDAVALGEHLVQLHGTQNGTDVGHRQINDRQLKVTHLVGRFRRVDHLNKAYRVDGDVGVIPGDDLLRGDIEHLLHHIDLAANAVHERHHQA